ncbi:uncharacterized protein FOMMEDRAFT_16883 [Fomitiporia mediterranea MF3/22]|uniref:uncharacterized protein n=1 Tax=Fomitiporia mediterranea (strain MF3/22) TaxID=694068 RepID=UPI000440821C|nr:uncharacterized protein FOMMEDRAFT_16883 [Fomitiporia mediterranea MF3/22]EJD08565.1 hypothetical protein FOMMEDRAFT_16883 [Fomitiporia mediterranea MF3/22]
MATTKNANTEEAESELETNIRQLFDRSVSNVQYHSSRIQEAYLVPAYERAKVFSQVYPVLSLYIAINAALGFFPVTTFLGASIFTLSASVSFAIVVALAFSALVIGLFALVLFFKLFSIALLSILLTFSALGVYQFTKLVENVRARPTWGAGFNAWLSQLYDFIYDRFPNKKSRDENVAHGKVEVHENLPLTDGPHHINWADQHVLLSEKDVHIVRPDQHMNMRMPIVKTENNAIME